MAQISQPVQPSNVMKNQLFSFVLFCSFFLGCQKAGPSYPAEEKFALQARQSFSLADGAQLTVNEIAESRCPTNARCIRMGNVTVRFGLSGSGQSPTGALCLGECKGEQPAQPMLTRDSVEISLAGQRYRIILEDVLPYPGIPGNPGVDTSPQSAKLVVKRL